MISAATSMKLLSCTIVGIISIYLAFLGLLTIPNLQDQMIYLHGVSLTWFQDLNVPEQWGFLKGQVTPFRLDTPDGELLHAWHILPLDVYRQHREELVAQQTSLAESPEEAYSMKVLKDDPTARLVLYFHGAAGTLGSGWRPQSYRALSAAMPNLHVLAIDYRGFGLSTGWPSEDGLLTDAFTLSVFAAEKLGIPAERIVLFGQSLGTAVALSLSHKLALMNPPTLFAGMVLVAPMADIETSTRTYKIAGVIPLLSPMAFYPPLLSFFNTLITSKWPSRDNIADLIGHLDSMEPTEHGDRYDVTLVHAEDDWDMPWIHSDILFSCAVRAMRNNMTLTEEGFQEEKMKRRTSLGAGGWEVEWRGRNGIVREQIVKYGLHDRIMSYPTVSMAIARVFEDARDECS